MKLKKIGTDFGAVISGLNLRSDLTDCLGQKIRELLLEYEVLFFKDQPLLSANDYLSAAEKIATPLAHPFGSNDRPAVPGISPFEPYPNQPKIVGIYHDKNNRGNLNEWHSDLNWLKNPSFGSILQARQVPKTGGDTLWASMSQAYKCLSDCDKQKLSGLKGIHDFSQIYCDMFDGNAQGFEKMKTLYPAQAHPVVLDHPLVSKKSIFVNRVSTTCIEGWEKEKSEALLEELFALPKKPEYQIRYKWEQGDIALWDNLSTQHYAVSDYWPQERRMHRISLKGIPLNQRVSNNHDL